MIFSLLFIGVFQTIKAIYIGSNYPKADGTNNILTNNLFVRRSREREEFDARNPNSLQRFSHETWLSNISHFLIFLTILVTGELVDRTIVQLLLPHIPGIKYMPPLSSYRHYGVSGIISNVLSSNCRWAEFVFLLDQSWYVAVSISFGLNLFGMGVEYYVYKYYNSV